MNEKEGKREGWKVESKRPSVLVTLAIVVMAIGGFAVTGGLALGATVAAKVTHSQGSAIAPHTPAEKITPALSKLLHVGMITKTTSTNWAGYADVVPNSENGTILESFGEWQVSAISCASHTPSINDNWVGIDGFGSGTVEQGGTYGYCVSPTSGPYYWDWYEFYPYEPIVSVNGVSPGDWINAYVLYNPYFHYGAYSGIYTIVVEDLSNNASSFVYQGNPSICDSNGCQNGPDHSVECISESLTNQGYYLPDYGTTTFWTCDAQVKGFYSGIGGLPLGAHATVYEITQYSPIVAGEIQQAVTKLTHYDYKLDHFSVVWKAYE